MALEVVGSTPINHPIKKTLTANIHKYKTLILGLRMFDILSVLHLNFIISEEKEMSKELEIMNLELRIHLLSNRDAMANARIISKLKRRLRKLTNNA